MAQFNRDRMYIFIDLAERDRYELIAASQLGTNLFRILEIPFYTDLLNLSDLVQCVAGEQGDYLFERVVKPSGHKTLQFAVSKAVDKGEWHTFLKSLIHPPYKFRNVDRFFAVDYPPGAKYDEARAELGMLIEKGFLTQEQMDQVRR